MIDLSKFHLRAWVKLAIAPAALVCSVMLSSAPAFADGEALPKLPGCKAEPAKRQIITASQKFMKSMEEVYKYLQPPEDPKTGKAPEADYKRAWPLVKSAIDKCAACKKAELAQLYQAAALCRYNLDDLPGATDYFKKVLAQSPDIPVSLETGITLQVAQLLNAQEKYADALKMFDKWESFCPANYPDSYFYSRGQAMYLMGKKTEALPMVQKSIDLAKQKGQPGQEAWHRLKLAIFVDQENYKSAEPVAETMVEMSPTVRNLSQLGSIYGMNEKTEKQLAILDALYSGGELTQERQYLNLAYLYAGAEAPYLASKVMQKGIDKNVVPRSAKNVETLAATLTQSKELEKALPVMIEAAQKMDNGKNFATLSAIYLDMEKYNESIDAARKAIQKGGLKSKAEVQMYLGSAYLGLKKYDEALNALSGAEGDSKYGAHALNLSKYIRIEKDREIKLNAAQKAPVPSDEPMPSAAPVEGTPTEPAKG